MPLYILFLFFDVTCSWCTLHNIFQHRMTRLFWDRAAAGGGFQHLKSNNQKETRQHSATEIKDHSNRSFQSTHSLGRMGQTCQTCLAGRRTENSPSWPSFASLLFYTTVLQALAGGGTCIPNKALKEKSLHTGMKITQHQLRIRMKKNPSITDFDTETKGGSIVVSYIQRYNDVISSCFLDGSDEGRRWFP